jgi:hypothetical protein
MNKPDKNNREDLEERDCAEGVMAGPRAHDAGRGKKPADKGGSEKPSTSRLPRSIWLDKKTNTWTLSREKQELWAGHPVIRPYLKTKPDPTYYRPGKNSKPKKSNKRKPGITLTPEQAIQEEAAGSEGFQDSADAIPDKTNKGLSDKERREWLTYFYFPTGLKEALRPRLEESPRTAREYERRKRRVERERIRKTALALYASGLTYEEVAAIEGMPKLRTVKDIVKGAVLEMHPVMVQLVRDVADNKRYLEKIIQWQEDFSKEAEEAVAGIYRDDDEITRAVEDFKRLH